MIKALRDRIQSSEYVVLLQEEISPFAGVVTICRPRFPSQGENHTP